MQNVFLTEVTTPRQAANGTRMFFCSDSGCYYGSYASGYIRRGIPTNIPGSSRSHIFYQLNKKKSSIQIFLLIISRLMNLILMFKREFNGR